MLLLLLKPRTAADRSYEDGASRIFPDRWEVYRDEIPLADRSGGFVAAYKKRLTSEDQPTRVSAARAWAHWETTTKALYPPTGTEALASDAEDQMVSRCRHVRGAGVRQCHFRVESNGHGLDTQAISMARIENHVKEPAILYP